MKKLPVLLMLLAFAGNIFAHQPDVSTTLLSQQTNGQWVLQVKAALTAFQYEVKTSFPDEKYASPEEFQDLVIRHMAENISILIDENKEVKLEQPFVRLGHETNVIFEAVGVPENFTKIEFINSGFKDINKNQSALVIQKEGFTQKQFVLNNKNQHTAQLLVKGTQFIASQPRNETTMAAMPNIFIGIIIIGFLGMLMSLKMKLSLLNQHE